MTKLQAHRGVSTEYPENTMASYVGAIEQGYEYIEVDPAITKDNVVVLLHDAKLSRTVRNKDGSEIVNPKKITDINYAELLEYDFGIAFHKKFKGERIPKLIDLLELAKTNNVKLKLDNKIWNFEVHGFSEEKTELVFELIKPYKENVAITCSTVSQIEKAVSIIPDVEIHYDGVVSEDYLLLISKIVPKERLTIWLPIQTKATSWVKVPFASMTLCNMVKKYASLGIWIVSEYEDFDRAVNEYKADIVETNGQIKPKRSDNLLVDLHSHTTSSHDGKSEVFNLCENAIKNNIDKLAITDHFDGVVAKIRDQYEVVLSSTKSATLAKEKYIGKLDLLIGVELGEAFWAMEEYNKIKKDFDFDVILGSMHTVRYKGFEDTPFSAIDFSKLSINKIKDYYGVYLDGVLENLKLVDFDVLTHLDNPLKYIKGKYKIELDPSCYAEKIDTILKYIIAHGISLEINTRTIDLYGECMPSWNVVKRYKELGGYLITVGADSHTVDRVGLNVKEVYGKLAELGFHNVFYYKKRKSYQITIAY